jgi:hypothetical protein
MPEIPLFDPLADANRWCVYCGADCWPEPENRRHAAACPMVTGAYPVLEQDRAPDGTFGACTVCSDPFALGDLYLLASDETGLSVDCPPEDSTSWVVCLPCGAAGTDPRGNGSPPAEEVEHG